MPSLSIVIPAFIRTAEQAVWLHEALLSVDNSTFKDVEIVVCDDGSPFDVHEVKEQWPDVRWLRTENCGPGAARNLAIGAAKSEWILPIDADDKFKPNGIKALWDKRCDRGYVYGDLEYIGSTQGVHILEDFSPERLMKLNGPNPIVTLHHKAAWYQVGGFDETLEGLEDIEYWVRLAASGVCGIHIHEVTFEYRKHAGSRQAFLTENGNERLKLIGPRIRAKHTNTWSKLSMANCDKCPGAGGSGPGPGQNGAALAEGVPQNAPALQYTGLKVGAFFVMGPETRIRYMVPGRGAWFKVHPSDMNYFMSFQNGSDSYAPEPPPPPPAPPRISEPMPLPQVETITDYDVKTALKMVAERDDPLDLNIWLAEEWASNTPREIVIAAIKKKRQSLQ